MQKNECGPQYYKMNSKWIEKLNGRAKSIKCLEIHIEINHYDLGLGNGSLKIMSKA